jgi:hypothetical protein
MQILGAIHDGDLIEFDSIFVSPFSLCSCVLQGVGHCSLSVCCCSFPGSNRESIKLLVKHLPWFRSLPTASSRPRRPRVPALSLSLFIRWSAACPCDLTARSAVLCSARSNATRTYGSLYSSSIRPSQQDSFLYTHFFRTHPSSISSSIHSIHCGTHLSLYLNISMCDLILKDLLRRI